MRGASCDGRGRRANTLPTAAAVCCWMAMAMMMISLASAADASTLAHSATSRAPLSLSALLPLQLGAAGVVGSSDNEGGGLSGASWSADGSLNQHTPVDEATARLITLRFSTTHSSSLLLTKMGLQYRITRPDVRVQTQQMPLSAQAFGELADGRVDAALTSLLPTADDQRRAPDVVHLPLWAYAFVPVTHVAEAAAVPLLLDVPVLCRIFSGNVTQWNDTALAALNPSVALPARPIEVALGGEAMAYVLQFTQLCGRLDAQFGGRIKASSTPVWPRDQYAKSTVLSTLTGTVSYVMANPDSIGLAFSTHARKLTAGNGATSLAKIASMRNAAGMDVQPSLVSLTAAMRERAIVTTRDAQGQPVYTFSNDLCNAPGPSSWPLVAPIMLAIPRTYTRTTCRARSELVKFLRWALDDESIRYTMFAAEDAALLPVDIDTHLGLSETLLHGVKCSEVDGANIGSSYAIMSGGGDMATMHPRAMNLFNRVYSQRSSGQLSVASATTNPARALDDLTNPLVEIDVAWFFPSTFRKIFPGELEEHIAQKRLKFMPWAAYGILPTYSFSPSMLLALRQRNALPLRATLEVLAAIFGGTIRSWDHPLLLEMNPALSQALAETGTHPAISLVLYGEGAGKTKVAESTLSNALVIALNHTASFQPSATGLPSWSLPPDWRPLCARIHALEGPAPTGLPRCHVLSSEMDLEPTVARVHGAVGYKLSFSNFSNPDTDFSIVKTVVPLASAGAGGQEARPYNVTVEGTPASFGWCAFVAPPSATVELDLLGVARRTDPAASGCWSLPLLVSAVLPADLKTVDVSAEDRAAGVRSTNNLRLLCRRQVAVAKFVDFLLFEGSLAVAGAATGYAPLTSVPWLHAATRAELDGVKCGGEEILVVPDVVWSLAEGVRMFAFFGGVLCFCGVLIAAALVLKFRQRSVIATARPPMQLMQLAGLAALFAVPVLFVMEATPALCHATGWLVSLGFTLTFVPITVKVWRVWEMARRKRHALRRAGAASVAALYATCAAHLAIDLALLAAQTQRGGLLVPGTVRLLQDSRVHVYSQCGLGETALPVVATLLAVKFFLLLSTSMMAFGVRHVSSAFGESVSLSWAVWNTLLSTAVITILVALVGDGAGDVHTFLLVFLVLWTGATTLAFSFGKKLGIVLLEEWRTATEASRLSRTSRTSRHSGGLSNTSGTGGTGTGTGSSFGTGSSGANSVLAMPPLDGVGLAVLERYMTALETQIRMAKRRYRTEYGNKGNWEKNASGAYDEDDEELVRDTDAAAGAQTTEGRSSFNFRGAEVTSMERARVPSHSFHQTKPQLVAPAPPRPAAAALVAPVGLPAAPAATSPPTPMSRSITQSGSAAPAGGSGAAGSGAGAAGLAALVVSPPSAVRQPLRINTMGGSGGGGGLSPSPARSPSSSPTHFARGTLSPHTAASQQRS